MPLGHSGWRCCGPLDSRALLSMKLRVKVPECGRASQHVHAGHQDMYVQGIRRASLVLRISDMNGNHALPSLNAPCISPNVVGHKGICEQAPTLSPGGCSICCWTRLASLSLACTQSDSSSCEASHTHTALQCIGA